MSTRRAHDVTAAKRAIVHGMENDLGFNILSLDMDGLKFMVGWMTSLMEEEPYLVTTLGVQRRPEEDDEEAEEEGRYVLTCDLLMEIKSTCRPNAVFLDVNFGIVLTLGRKAGIHAPHGSFQEEQQFKMLQKLDVVRKAINDTLTEAVHVQIMMNALPKRLPPPSKKTTADNQNNQNDDEDDYDQHYNDGRRRRIRRRLIKEEEEDDDVNDETEIDQNVVATVLNTVYVQDPDMLFHNEMVLNRYEKKNDPRRRRIMRYLHLFQDDDDDDYDDDDDDDEDNENKKTKKKKKKKKNAEEQYDKQDEFRFTEQAAASDSRDPPKDIVHALFDEEAFFFADYQQGG